MKIIEALKEIPLIDKKINRNAELLQKYSSDIVLGDGLLFKTEDAQVVEVNALLQSTQDLVKQRAELKRRLQITNAKTKVEISDLHMTISEWIEYKNWGIPKIQHSLLQLNESNSMRPFQVTPQDAEKGMKRYRFYDEAAKNEKINFYTELLSKITARLEIVNATTDLVE